MNRFGMVLFLMTVAYAIGISSCNQAYEIDYSDPNNWLKVTSSPQYDADVFYLYPTVWMPTEADGIVNTIDNASMRENAPKAYDGQASCFEGVANVYFPNENCAFAAYTLRFLNEFLFPKELKEAGIKPDVIHWNCGLWDCLRQYGEDPNTPLEIYEYYIERVCERLKKLCPDAKIIFATSTYVQTEKMNPNHFIRYNDEIDAYNNVAVNIVKKYGMEIDDLCAVSATLPAEAHSDNVHYYTPMGTKAFADSVLKHLATALELESVPEYVEDLYKEKPIGF